jgi:hypothetical protein
VGPPVAVDEARAVEARSPVPIEPEANPPEPKVVPSSNRLRQGSGGQEVRFSTFWEFAVAVNRADQEALALARSDATASVPVEATELMRLLGMMWCGTVFGRFSRGWRERLLDVLIENATVGDHAVKRGRQTLYLHELGYEELVELGAKTSMSDWIRPDLDLLLTVGRFWGPEAVKRLRFVKAPERREPSMVESLLHRIRG